MNARGQISQFTSGNGLATTQTFDHGFLNGIQTGTIQNLQYSWDKATGNLTWRKDANRSLTENFAYDNLDRLTGITGSTTANYTFNTNGNIATSTLAGAFTYNSVKPHAMESVTNPQGLIPYTGQNIQYTSFDKVKQITEDAKTVNLYYGADKERRKMVYNDGTNTLTRYYAHGNYEKETGANVRELHYITAGTGVAAIYETKTAGNNMYYIHKDHLGSVNIITNDAGTIVEEMSFDAWGRRRNPTNWTYTGVSSTHLIDRGYTGHEHLDGFGIINMNGRVYDPLTGRFLSPDNQVQGPEFTQSYNRYSYCMNNPLKYTDPTGWTKRPSVQYRGATNPGGGSGDYYNYSSYWNTNTYFTNLEGPFTAQDQWAELLQNEYKQVHTDLGYSNWLNEKQHSYTYNQASNSYHNAFGQQVSYQQVYNNYVVPNAAASMYNTDAGWLMNINPHAKNTNLIAGLVRSFDEYANNLIDGPEDGLFQLCGLQQKGIKILESSLYKTVIQLDHQATVDLYASFDIRKKVDDLTLALMPMPAGTSGKIVGILLKVYAGGDFLFGDSQPGYEQYIRFGKEQGVTIIQYTNYHQYGISVSIQINQNLDNKVLGYKCFNYPH